jgi:hypothetical protein
MTPNAHERDRLLKELADALAAQRSAKIAGAEASTRIAAAMRGLMRLRLGSFRIATAVSRLLGETMDVSRRRRLARALTKRAWRHAPETRGPQIQNGPPGDACSDTASCSGKEAAQMPGRLVKKTTVTEEYLDEQDEETAANEDRESEDEVEDDDEPEDEVDAEDEDEEEEEEEDSSRRRRGRARRA